MVGATPMLKRPPPLFPRPGSGSYARARARAERATNRLFSGYSNNGPFAKRMFARIHGRKPHQQRSASAVAIRHREKMVRFEGKQNATPPRHPIMHIPIKTLSVQCAHYWVCAAPLFFFGFLLQIVVGSSCGRVFLPSAQLKVYLLNASKHTPIHSQSTPACCDACLLVCFSLLVALWCNCAHAQLRKRAGKRETKQHATRLSTQSAGSPPPPGGVKQTNLLLLPLSTIPHIPPV